MAWTIGSLPELAILDSADRRQLLRRLPMRRLYAGLVTQSAFLGLLVGSFLYGVLFRKLAVAGIFVAAAWYRFALLRVRAALRLELMRRSEETQQQLPVCLRCGYDLAAVQVDRCPECGAPSRVASARRPGAVD